jgi:hypothetical protein
VAADRDPVYELVSRAVQASAAQGQALAGSLFWRWGFNHWDAQQPGDYGEPTGGGGVALLAVGVQPLGRAAAGRLQ